MRVAVVHDWLTELGGAERVLEQILALHPEADLFSMVDFLPEADRGWLAGRRARTSFVQSLPLARRRYRWYLPLMPLAVEQWDFSAYDLVISSSYAVVKGLITGPDQVHMGYVHSPMRYAWDLQGPYLEQAGLAGLKGWPARWMLHRLRLWDQVASQRVDWFVANSGYVAGRIRKLYRRPATVVHPPVATDRFRVDERDDGYYLAVSRLVPYKRLDLIAEAFSGLPDLRLVIIGDGPEMARVKAKAGANVEILGRQSDAVVEDHLARCRAFVFAAVEDFGIAPLEAQACGKPVIALARGGVRETLGTAPVPTSVLFDHQTVPALQNAVRRFEAVRDTLTPNACRANAERFSPSVFRRALANEIENALQSTRFA